VAIAITGGPCAGKSTFMYRAKQWLENRGIRVAILSEVATEIITQGFLPMSGWKNNLDFQQHLLRYMILRENMYYEMLRNQDIDKPKVILCDRGALDAIAYVGRLGFLEVVENVDPAFDVHKLRERYRGVIHLVTAADGAEQFYTLENNQARDESPELARALDRKTFAAWNGHQHLSMIDNKSDFEKKMFRALTSLARILHMPEPLEIERKFEVLNFERTMLPEDAVEVFIVQDYLSDDGNGGVRRVRSRNLDGATSYFLTTKKPTGERGTRIEIENQISQKEYETLLREKDPELMTVKKFRNTFPHEGRVMELDIMLEPLYVSDRVFLEVEVPHIDAEVVLPPQFEVVERTDDNRYSNHSIAAGIIPERD
jgi:CYTH domain-containing protein/thymidylate kinase